MGSDQKVSKSNMAPWVTLLVVALPLMSWTVLNLALNLRYIVLGGILLCALLALLTPSSSPTNHFISSGRNPPASKCRELLLKSKGGRSTNAYWCDPSIAFGHLSDFQYTESPRNIDFKTLLAEKGDVIGPYCVDDESRSIVFVETEPEFDPAEVGPFYFQSQRDHAVRVYTVPFEEYHRVIADLDPEISCTKKLLLVYNTARCGSTLLSKCMDQLASTRSYSEPDVLTSLTHIASEARGSRDAELVALARSSTKLLCYLRRRRYPDCKNVCIKFRFQMVYIADLVHKALPEAKSIFLYRNALDVVDSMAAAFINTGLYRAVRKIGVDVFYVFHISTLPQNLPKLMPLMNDKERFPVSCYKQLGAVCPFVFSWISVMHYALKAYRAGSIQACLRYEDMIVGKTALVAKMLGAVGLLQSDEKVDVEKNPKYNSDNVFKKDAHTGVTQSKRTVFNEETGATEVRGFVYLRGTDPDMIRDVLARHEEIEHSDYIIPGTISL